MKEIKIILIMGLIALIAILPATAAGQGNGNNNGAGQNLVLPEPENYNLTDIEVLELQYMREEEQMANDLYTVWEGMYSLPIFGNIAKAEETHIGEVQFLIDRYHVPANMIGDLSSGYGNPDLQVLSASLAKQGNLSLNNALKGGVLIENQDIADLDKAIANTSRADILQVYNNLRNGSENHLDAFSKQSG
jgi:hypothetical protein